MSAAALPHAEPPDAETFVRSHQAGLWRWLRTLGCAADRAEEHCQDALLAGLHHGVAARPHAEASRWLRTAARNFYFMRLRAERRRPAAVSLDTLEAHWARVRGDDDGGDGAILALADCVRALPAREQELVALRYEQELPRPVIGLQLGIGDAGAKQALRRLRERLRRCVQGRLGFEET